MFFHNCNSRAWWGGGAKLAKYWDFANHFGTKLLMEDTDTFQRHLHSLSDLLQGDKEH